jgi:hypothetical protein
MPDVLDTSGFTGSTQAFRHPLTPGFTFSDGVQYVAEKAGAYWLIDVIFSYQHTALAKGEEFQVWTLQKHADNTATVTMSDGNSEKHLISQVIPFTDFPQEKMVMWLANKMLYLPSEH